MSAGAKRQVTEPAARFEGPGAWRAGLCYGLLGLPLAFVALPLYVLLPNHYAREFGVSLAALGLLLMAVRLLDAVVDPWIGTVSDRWFRRSARTVLGAGALAALALAIGFVALFFPPAAVRADPSAGLLMWAAAALVLAYGAYSVLTVTHQAWGAGLGGSETQRSRVVAWREGLGLLGVVVASVLPTVAGLGVTAAVLALALGLAVLGWSRAPRPAGAVPGMAPATAASSPWAPLRQAAFRRLLLVFVLNGIASAVPATLVLFFVQDRLQAPATMEPLFLGCYFLCAALALPLWLRVVARLGLARTWLVGMLLAMAVFVWAASLGPGDAWAFVLVCALSGVALGTDLALPGALLAGLLGTLGERGQREGAYFGWWSFATKMNLALAAGLALPALEAFGYTPGARSDSALHALVMAYCLIPCALKALAAWALHVLVIRPAAPRAPLLEPSS